MRSTAISYFAVGVALIVVGLLVLDGTLAKILMIVAGALFLVAAARREEA